LLGGIKKLAKNKLLTFYILLANEHCNLQQTTPARTLLTDAHQNKKPIASKKPKPQGKTDLN
jgi:hypothetical protein